MIDDRVSSFRLLPWGDGNVCPDDWRGSVCYIQCRCHRSNLASNEELARADDTILVARGANGLKSTLEQVAAITQCIALGEPLEGPLDLNVDPVAELPNLAPST